MHIATIAHYLAGRRAAILEIAADRKALVVGALLVLSAALARNYDQAPLVHEPWRLLGPFVASIAISGPLFLTVYVIGWLRGMKGPGIGKAYLSFLALYWMTAPLAWLYGIPYEAFLSPVDAVRANLWTLALVSTWRVALMVRVVSVIFNLRVRAALALVMLVADTAALLALYLVPLPVVAVMGGINPANQVIAVTAFLVMVLGWLTLPVWLVLAGIAAYSWRNLPEWTVPSTPERPVGSRRTHAVAALVPAVWAVLLPFTQPAQNIAWRVERAYRTRGPAAALALMSAHNRSDFPTGWQPPPPRFPAEPPTSEFIKVLEVMADEPVADWVRALYVKRFSERVEQGFGQWPDEPLEHNAPRLAGILTRLPEGPEIAQAVVDALPGIDYMLTDDSQLKPEERSALHTLVRLAGKGKPEKPAAPKHGSP